jgi:hypothetical protein
MLLQGTAARIASVPYLRLLLLMLAFGQQLGW